MEVAICMMYHCHVVAVLPLLVRCVCREEELELDDDDYELLEEAGVHGVKVGGTGTGTMPLFRLPPYRSGRSIGKPFRLCRDFHDSRTVVA